ncbi:hypothetical protein [Sinorhizobium meliloti]|uniref:hypothetical protein n=1 Tax=Rhizobium meliloti TaxID=382 RepID=UPI001E44C445|nr:hypothetical protein [Sinorhizobium meliloti]UFX12745.1 hypothetical protein SmelRRI128_32680 [Sinorhizobium meliloti]
MYNTTTEHPRDRGSRAFPWHPWSGQFVHVHEALAKGTAIFRCSLSGASSDRLVEVPAWMFDRSVSGYWRSLPVPHVGLASLHTLAKLLEEVGASSQCVAMGAALVSHETSRGDVHATPVHDISVRSVLGPTPGELPEETRQALTALIVRLFVDHASDASASQQKEVGHDA